MKYFIFMTTGGTTQDDTGNDVENCQQISDPIEVEDDCGALEAYNKMLADRSWNGAFDRCHALELVSPNISGTFDLINDEDEEDD
jgi:hypothetical protein